jgi:hypothetical protein
VITVGDRVQPWHWIRYLGGWSFNVPAGLTVREVHGPMLCDCDADLCRCDHADARPYYYVVAALQPPHDQRHHDHHFRVCEIPGRPWQMRRNGTALVVLERASRHSPARAPQMELFA